jgi:hypothetical protein
MTKTLVVVVAVEARTLLIEPTHASLVQKDTLARELRQQTNQPHLLKVVRSVPRVTTAQRGLTQPLHAL